MTNDGSESCVTCVSEVVGVARSSLSMRMRNESACAVLIRSLIQRNYRREQRVCDDIALIWCHVRSDGRMQAGSHEVRGAVVSVISVNELTESFVERFIHGPSERFDHSR